MFKTKQFLILALALAGAALAQTADAPKFYKLDFVVKEVEGGKVVNSRSYSAMLAVQMPGSSAQAASIRAGGRIPVTSGPNTPGMVNTQFQFYDVGVNIDARDLHETPTEVSLSILADITTLVQESTSPHPVTRQNKWQGPVVVTIKKPTTVFTSDDVSSKRQLQLELTATSVK